MYYHFKELREKALSKTATVEDRLNLVEWCSRYDLSWNGECYNILDGLYLYPIYQGVGEPDDDGDFLQYEVVDAEIR